MAETESYIWQSIFPESPRRRPCHRSRQAACRYRSQIYVYGGRDSYTTLHDFWRYDTATNIWTSLECGGETPAPLQEHTMVAANGCLFIFGGELGYGSCGETPLWIYNLTEQTWEKPAIKSEVMTPTGRRGHTAVVWRGGMHVYGGYIDLKGSSGEMWTLDFETRWWHLSVDAQLDNSSPCPRHWHSAVVHGSNMWVYGGLNNLQPLKDLWKWDFESKLWIRVKCRQSPGFLHGHSAVRVANSMMIFGGEDGEGTFRKDLWRFDFGSGSWQSVTPNRRLAPTSCTRHVLLSVPSNQRDESQLYTSTTYPRPQSAPNQAFPNSHQADGVLSTPKGHLADLFILRPYSSPPIMANDRRNREQVIHHFVNRVHPSPTDNTSPVKYSKRTAFDSQYREIDKENKTLTSVDAQNTTNVCFKEGGTKMEDGRWAATMAINDAAIYDTWTENGRWAVLSLSFPEHEIEKEQTVNNLICEESPIGHLHGNGSRCYQQDMPTDASLHQQDWILEDISSEPSSPVQKTDHKHPWTASSTDEGACTPSDILGSVADTFSKSDKMCNNLPQDAVAELSKSKYPNCIGIPRERSKRNASCQFCDTFLEHPDACERSCTCCDIEKTNVPEHLTKQEPQDSKILPEKTPPSEADIFSVKHLNEVGEILGNVNINTEGVHLERQRLLPSNEEKPLTTFVNSAFISSFEDLSCNFTSNFSTIDTTENRTSNQSDGAYIPVSQSETALYSLTGQVCPPIQSQLPLVTVNGTTVQSDMPNLLFHQSQPEQFEPNPHHHIIHVNPTNQKILEMTNEESGQVIYPSNLKVRDWSNSGSSGSTNSRSMLHDRSQTPKSQANEICRGIERPQTLGLRSDSSLGERPDQKSISCDDEEDEWTWPVFLYLMGGEETGSCSLHQNSSPMSVWKCCIVQGKPTDIEVQHLMSRH